MPFYSTLKTLSNEHIFGHTQFKENKLQVVLKPKELVGKESVVRLPKPSVTPFKRTVIAWVGINNRFSQRSNGSEISHGALSNQEDSKQAGKYLRKHYDHQDS